MDRLLPQLNTRRRASIPIVALATVAALVAFAPTARAHGTADQTSVATSPVECASLSVKNQAQTFTPTLGTIVSLDLLAEAYTGDRQATVSILEGGPTGTVLSTQSVTFPSANVPTTTHVDLPATVSVVPGNTYTIFLTHESGNNVHPCRAAANDSTYAGGEHFFCNPGGACTGTNRDLIFTTYGTDEPPDTTITAMPANPSATADAVFEFTGDDDVTASGDLTFECSLDDTGFAPCTSGDNFGPVGNGAHRFEVRAIDELGQPDPTPALYEWTVAIPVAATGCMRSDATIWVDAAGFIHGGPQDGTRYRGLLLGTAGDDVMVGTPGPDVIRSQSGNDIICGWAGDDMIYAGANHDKVYAGAGNDSVWGEGGNDRLNGNGGDDDIFGGGGRDTMRGNAGADDFDGGPGMDKTPDFNPGEGDTSVNVP